MRFLSRLKQRILRHKAVTFDATLLSACVLFASYIAYAVDIFHEEGALDFHESMLELNEALLLGTLLCGGLLVLSLRQYRAQKREIARRIAAERNARELAYQDALTGLPNRRQYEEALKAAIAAPPRAGGAHGVFMLDLNGFKKINDVHGHGAGDAVLCVVAQRLQSAMRNGDMVARFGGDEFAILAKQLSGPEAATNVALRVIDVLSHPIEACGSSHAIGTGIGIALVPSDAHTIEEALRKADVALYRAKAEKRSTHRFFEAAMDTWVHGRAAMELALRQALDADVIETMYQPTVDLRTQEVIGFEASPRWVDATQGEIPAERFIAIAEEVGLIHELAEQTLRHACRSARAWPSHVALVVEIHPGQLKDKFLSERMLQVLSEHGIAPSRLEVDITESALVADMEGAEAVLDSLRSAGVRISLRNFGTGYSSLYHLRNFKLDKIKIDRSFVQAMTSERESAGIVNALVGLGKGLGLVISAEGIDVNEQAHSLLSTGCAQGQGQFFGSLLTAEQAAGLLMNRNGLAVSDCAEVSMAA